MKDRLEEVLKQSNLEKEEKLELIISRYDIIKNKISQKIFNKLKKNYSSFEMMVFFNPEVEDVAKKAEQVLNFPKRWDKHEVNFFISNEIYGEDLKRLSKRFDFRDVLQFMSLKEDYDQDRMHYRPRYRILGDVKKLSKEDFFSPKHINSYKCDNTCIYIFLKNKIPSSIANKYPKMYWGVLNEVIEEDCGPEDINKYPKQMHISDRLHLFSKNIGGKFASKFSKNYSVEEIFQIKRLGIYSKNFISKIKSCKIVLPELLKVEKKIFPERDQDAKIKNGLIERIERLEKINKGESLGVNHQLIYVGSGASGLIMGFNYFNLKFNKAFKFFFNKKSRDVEYENLRRLSNLKNVNHVIRLHKDPISEYNSEQRFIELESGPYSNLTEFGEDIEGDKNEVIRIGNHLLKGLHELHQAGIMHHRDLRPANILQSLGSEWKNNIYFITDLGIATTNKYAKSKCNRRFGGPNDLVSIGQILYKVYTGRKLFSKSESMEKTVYASKVKDYRDWIYESKPRLNGFNNKIKYNINDKVLYSLIKSCITAKENNPKEILNLYEDVFRKI